MLKINNLKNLYDISVSKKNSKVEYLNTVLWNSNS